MFIQFYSDYVIMPLPAEYITSELYFWPEYFTSFYTLKVHKVYYAKK